MIARYFLGTVICIGLATAAAVPAQADLKYYPDPAYKRLNSDDPQPMEEMVELANQGDTRAMFILGDMYEKGKGGLAKDLNLSKHWFEESAIHGYNQSFIRLAAMAKHDNNPVEAWQWYTLAIDSFDYGDTQQYAIRARKELTDGAKLSSDDTDKARKAMSDWKDARDKQLRTRKTPLPKRNVCKKNRKKKTPGKN